MRRERWVWLAAAALAALLWCGCAGILSEKVDDEGKIGKVAPGHQRQMEYLGSEPHQKRRICLHVKKRVDFLVRLWHVPCQIYKSRLLR